MPAPPIEVRENERGLRRHLWPALGKQRTPGDILYWPRTDHIVPFTHWAVYVGRRRLGPDGGSWMEGRCSVTGAELPEAVVHLWGAADASTRDISSDAVVVHTALEEVGGSAYDGNLCYDNRHTPMRTEQILERVLVALDRKLYEERFGGYHVLGNNCEHFCTWVGKGVGGRGGRGTTRRECLLFISLVVVVAFAFACLVCFFSRRRTTSSLAAPRITTRQNHRSLFDLSFNFDLLLRTAASLFLLAGALRVPGVRPGWLGHDGGSPRLGLLVRGPFGRGSGREGGSLSKKSRSLHEKTTVH